MPAVTGTRLSLAYGSKTVLEDSTFEIPSGAITAIIGPNGSGKSSLLNAVAGLLRPVAGTLEVLGNPPEAGRLGVSYVLQSTKVNETMPVSVREVVSMARFGRLGLWRRAGDSDHRAVAGALDRLDLTEIANTPLSELSVGQRQRVFVAQGLAQEAQLLMLDEPTNALDLPSREQIERTLAEERTRGTAVVVTTHDLSEAGTSDHVLLLSRRVVASGPPLAALTPAALETAYGTSAITGVRLDDSAHGAVGSRHQHFDRTGHAEH